MNDDIRIKVEPRSFDFVEPFPWRDASWVWMAFISLGMILGVIFVVLTGY